MQWENPQWLPQDILLSVALVYSYVLFCISLYICTSVHPHCFLCLQPSQCCWELLIPSRIFSCLPAWCVYRRPGHPGWRGWGLGGGGDAAGAGSCSSSADLAAHTQTTLYNPWAKSVSSSPLVSTNAHSTFSLFPALPLCSHCHPSTAHKPTACWEN